MENRRKFLQQLGSAAFFAAAIPRSVHGARIPSHKEGEALEEIAQREIDASVRAYLEKALQGYPRSRDEAQEMSILSDKGKGLVVDVLFGFVYAYVQKTQRPPNEVFAHRVQLELLRSKIIEALKETKETSFVYSVDTQRGESAMHRAVLSLLLFLFKDAPAE